MKELLRKLSIMAGTYYINIHGTIWWSSNDRDIVAIPLPEKALVTQRSMLLPWMEATRARARQLW